MIEAPSCKDCRNPVGKGPCKSYVYVLCHEYKRLRELEAAVLGWTEREPGGDYVDRKERYWAAIAACEKARGT